MAAGRRSGILGTRHPSARARTGAPIAALVFAALFPAAVYGSSINVNTEVDAVANDGQCSLREAVSAANTDAASGAAPGECAAGAGADTIVLPAGFYRLSLPPASENANAGGDLDILADVSITGAGAATTTISGGGLDRVFDISGSGSTVTIEDVTVTGGHAPDGPTQLFPGQSGGGIANLGNLTLRDARVSDNVAGRGGDGRDGQGEDGLLGHPGGPGGGFNGQDGGSGGGISNGGSLTLIGSSVTGNRAGDGGRGGSGT